MERAQMVNVYTCPVCGWKAVTRNLVAGVTPMFIKCEGPERCDAKTFPVCGSSCYRVDQKQEPTHEWYKPTEDELMRRPWMIEHVAKGGLALRRVGQLEADPA